MGTEVLLELILVDGLPGDDHAEEVVPDSVIGGGHTVALLTATGVHDSESLLRENAGLLTAEAVKLVDTSSGEGASSGCLRKSGGDGTARVGDERADHARLVRVALLEQSDADELMRRNEVVEELLDVVGEAIPVTIGAVDELGEGFGHGLLRSVPKGLNARVTHGLGCAHNSNRVDWAILESERVSNLLLASP